MAITAVTTNRGCFMMFSNSSFAECRAKRNDHNEVAIQAATESYEAAVGNANNVADLVPTPTCYETESGGGAEPTSQEPTSRAAWLAVQERRVYQGKGLRRLVARGGGREVEHLV